MGIGPIELVYALLSFVLFVGFWAVVILVVVRLLRRGESPGPRSPGLQVLEERYARGEISHDEFVERRSVLLGGN